MSEELPEPTVFPLPPVWAEINLAALLHGTPKTHTVLAQIEREEFDAAKANAATAGRIILRATIVPKSAVEKCAKAIGDARRKDAAKKAAAEG